MPLTTNIYQRIVSAKIFIDENFNEPITLEQISAKAFISQFHFHRLFKSIYKKTPQQYLIEKRIEKAKELLAKEGLSITDVCDLVGYESLASFSLLFKKQSGSSPQYYRNIAWLKKQLAKEQPKRFVPHCFVETYNL
jgi:AraC-like DNA-binding protein